MSDEARISFNIRFDHPVIIWMLQLGGWLPLQFTPVSVVLVDKNVLRAIEDIRIDSEHPDMAALRWWLSNLNSERFMLNAILCAHEGDVREIPNYSQFRLSLAEYHHILSSALPRARIVEHQSSYMEQLYENVTATAERHAREKEFLLQVAQSLHQRASAANARRLERTILQAARDYALSLHSFVVLAALSCLYEPQDGSEPMIGRGVIKPTPTYSAADAHNALSDLRSLELLALAVGLEGSSIGYCTRDKYLAAFWTYLRVNEPRWSDNSFTAHLAPAPELFPRLDENALREMFLRLQ